MGIGDQGCREIKQGATADKARISYKHIPWSPISNRVGRAFSATRTNLRNRYLLIRHQSFPTLVSVGIMGAVPGPFGRLETGKYMNDEVVA